MTTTSVPATAVVVGVDGSSDGRRAVQWAAADAARRRRPLHLLHGHEWPTITYPMAGMALPVIYETETRESPARILADAVLQARDVDAELQISTEATAELCVPALLEASRHASLVVVGNRGLGGFTALLVGSTGVELASHATCPVVIVRHAEHPDGGNTGRVVIGVDGSHGAHEALGVAFEQAAFRGCGLTAIHAYHRPPAGADPGTIRHGERLMLAESLAGWREKYPQVDVRLDAAPGRAGGVLTDASAGAQLLVVGARGRGGFVGLLLGSVSQAVVHHACCPVAVVRHPDR
ncbi:universal stress protein [Dactylosporangium sp. NBC_01737]|uniref:universal stress protein n=1 Tax=Dactylosporangium sp. NBC_01737 TaxID=2975959 RepID=UPI002E128421|nr:universal stress protein [Dactylosporangium sp. NBC_01737]